MKINKSENKKESSDVAEVRVCAYMCVHICVFDVPNFVASMPVFFTADFNSKNNKNKFV